MPFTRHPFFIYSENENMIQPIWKDYIVDLNSSVEVSYYIAYIKNGSQNIFYSGVAQRKPDESSTRICINDVCADWLISVFPSLADSFTASETPVEFVVANDRTYEEYGRVRFINDWSYDEQHDAERDGLAAPINGHIDSRQYLMWSGIDVEEAEADVTFTDGTTMKVFIPVAGSADFNEDFNADFSKALRAAGSGTAVFPISQWGDVAKVVVNGVQYDVVPGCARYVLYYLNAYGGWDSFLIEGASVEQDNLTRHTMNKAGVLNRHTTNYQNDITKKITLYTSWLSDEQSLRMHNLLNSTNVYLHDLERNEILPVVVEGTTTPYKTYKNQGCKLFNYTIDVTIAQERKRR